MFAYCGNNPIVRRDASGYVWETVFDVVSLGLSIADVVANPNDGWAWAGLVGDIVDVAVPFVGGVGEIIKAARLVDTVADTVDTVHDIDKAIGVVEDVGTTARKADFYVTPTGEAIPATLADFENNLTMLDYQNGKYLGFDSQGPIRFRVNEIHEMDPDFTGVQNPLHTVLHFHIDRRANGLTGKWGKVYTGPMEMLR